MTAQTDLTQLLFQAEQALADGDWSKARQLYEQVLSSSPYHPRATEGLAKIQRLERVDADIQEKIAAGDEFLETERLREAFDAYTDALNLGGNSGILRYHRMLEQKRNQVRDLLAWEEHVEKTLSKVTREAQEGNLEDALARVNASLSEVPTGKYYEGLRHRLQQTREDLESRLEDADKFRRAQEAFKDGRYDECVRLAGEIRPESEFYNKSKRLKGSAEALIESIAPVIQQVTRARKEKRWEDAFAELDILLSKYPDNKMGHDQLLQVGREYGVQELDAGREANTRREFDKAKQHFEQAQEALERVLKVYKAHRDVSRMRNEAKDLIKITTFERQAQEDWEQGRRREAIAALDRALAIIERAGDEGQEYSTVAATVRSMYDAITNELERIQGEELAVHDGERLLKEGHFQEAADRFREALNALEEEHRRRANEGLSQAEAEIKEFEQDMRAGERAKDPFKAVEHFRRAYERWSDGPDVLERLNAALVEAGRAAMRNGDETRAGEYFNQAVLLTGDETARRELSRMEATPKIKSGLSTVRESMRDLLKSAKSTAKNFEELQETLEDLLEQARPYEDLRREVESLLSKNEEYRKRWEQFERLYREADEHRQAGRWQQAIDKLQAGIAALGDTVPAGWQDRLREWKQAADKARTAEEEIKHLMLKAQEEYRQVNQTEDRTALTNALDGARQNLYDARQHLDKAEQTTGDAGGGLTDELRRLRGEVDNLQQRVQLALEAVNSRSAADGLLFIRQARQKYHQDAVLRFLEEWLDREAQGEVEQLVNRAKMETEAGNLKEALDLLRRASELRPGDEQITTMYGELSRRGKLEDKLGRLFDDYESKLGSGSKIDARDALRRGIETLIDPEQGMSEEERSVIQELLLLERQRSGLAFGYQEVWGKVEEKLSLLAKKHDPLVVKAVQWVDLWARLAHDIALLGVISSEAQVGKLLEAYRAARQNLMAHPEDESAINKEADIRRQFWKQLNTSVSKRLERAKEALEREDFQVALENLEAIETEFYRPIEEKGFKHLLEGADEVENNRLQAEEILSQAKKIQKIYEENQPYLEQAEAAYAQGELDEAEKQLLKVTNLEQVPRLKRRQADLLEKVQAARRERAAASLNKRVIKARADRATSGSVEEVRRIVDTLREAEEEIDLRLLPKEALDEYYNLLRELENLLEDSELSRDHEKRAREYESKGQYREAIGELKKAIERADSKRRKQELEAHREEIQRILERQERIDNTLQEGQDALSRKEYKSARVKFTAARREGAPSTETESLLQAARAGELVVEAEELLREDDLEGAQEEAEAALKAIGELQDEQLDVVVDVVNDVKRRARRIKNLVKKRQNVEKHLAQASTYLTMGQTNKALEEVNAALKLDPGNEKCHAMQERLQQQMMADRILEEAESLMADGDYTGALSRVETVLQSVLPNYYRALMLKSLLEKGRRAHELLAKAELLARNNEFQQARETLQKAIDAGALPENVREVQKKLEDLEQKWENETLHPIRDNLLDERYPDALRICKRALEQVASPDFRTKLEGMQNEIVNRWAERVLSNVRDRMQREKEPDALEQQLADIEHMLALEPSPSQDILSELRSVRDKLRTALLKHRLDEARSLADKERWEEALNIIQEVEDEAKNGRLNQAIIEATLLRMDVEKRKEDWELNRNRSKREQLLQEARERKEQASGPSDFERVSALAEEILRLPGFENDGEAQDLKEWARQEKDLFERTGQSLIECEKQIFNHRFLEAEKPLIHLGGRVSYLLKDRYDRMNELVTTLRQAERDRDSGVAWDSALKGYRQAVELEPRLEGVLRKDQERCRRQLMKDVLEQARRAVETEPPQITVAIELLDKAQSEGWVAPDSAPDVKRLRRQIESLKNIEEASTILEEHGDPSKALTMLQLARNALPTGADDRRIKELESFARAMLAWQHQNWEQADEYLRQLTGTPLGDSAPVRNLRNELEARFREEQAEGEIRSHLDSTPPGYEAAVERFTKAIKEVGSEAIESLRTLIRSRLQAALDAARGAGRYTEAIQIAESLKKLAPDDADVLALTGELLTEQQQALSDALDRARAAIRNYRLSEADKAIRQAQTILEPETSRELEDLQEELQRKESQVSQADSFLDEARQASITGHWDKVVKQIEKAKRAAPNYARTSQVSGDILSRMYEQAQLALAGEEFGKALDIYEQGLRLGPSPMLEQLRREIVNKTNAYLDDLRSRISASIGIWDTDEAHRLLERGFEIAPRDDRLVSLRQQLDWAMGKSGFIKSKMEEGWKALQRRELEKAKEHFDLIQKELPFFREAALWLHYTDNLEKAIRILRSDEVDEYPALLELLKKAGESVQLRPGEPLPALWSDLWERRRQAAWDAHQLSKLAGRLKALHEKYDRYSNSGRLREAFDLLDSDIENIRKRMLDLYEFPTVPPDDFTGLVGETIHKTRQPVAPPPKPEPVAPPPKPEPVAPPPKPEPVAPPPKPEPVAPPPRPEPVASPPRPEPVASPPRPETTEPYQTEEEEEEEFVWHDDDLELYSYDDEE